MNRYLWCACVVLVAGFGGLAAPQILNTSDAETKFRQESELLRTDLRAAKLEIVTKNMGLTQAEGEKFWPIYYEYEAKLQTIWNERITLIAEYGSLYPNVPDAKAASLIERSLDLDSDIAKLRKSYYQKMKKALSGKIATRFVQLDRRINSLLDIQVSNSIPLVK